MLCGKFPQAQYIYLSEVVHVVKATRVNSN